MASVTNQISPPVQGRAITPTDGLALPLGVCRYLYIGGAGNVSVILANDTAAITLVGVPVGTTLPLMCKAVQATGTTATNIVALY